MIEVDTSLVALLGLPRHSTWTWRAKLGRYFQRGSATAVATMALVLDTRSVKDGKVERP